MAVTAGHPLAHYMYSLPAVLQRNIQPPSLSISIPLSSSFTFSFLSPSHLDLASTGYFPEVTQDLCPLSVEVTAINGRPALTQAHFA